MKSSICIRMCLSSIGTDLETDERSEDIKDSILIELHAAIRKIQLKRDKKPGRVVVHVTPRRFQFYGLLGIFTEDERGEYKLDLPVESWIVSDRNIGRNKFFVMIE